MNTNALRENLPSILPKSAGKNPKRWINAESNIELLSTSFQRNSENELRKQIADLQNQVKILKTENENQKKLINNLSANGTSLEDESLDVWSQIGALKSELKMTVEKLKMVTTTLAGSKEDLKKEKDKVDQLERYIKPFEEKVESLEKIKAKNDEMIKTQRKRISDLEVSLLEESNRDLQQKNLDLESINSTHGYEKDESERKIEVYNVKLDELASKVATLTGIEIPKDENGLDILINKIDEMINKNSMIKDKLMIDDEQLSANESEKNLDQETTKRLDNKLNNIEKDSMNNEEYPDEISEQNKNDISDYE